MTSPFASWFVHEVTVRRYLRKGTGGADLYSTDETVHGWYRDKTEFQGGQIVTTGRFAFAPEVAYIPVQSQVVLPAQFGGRTVQVVASEVGDPAGLPLPAHQVIGVK